jgi:hypothetical protein
MTSDSVSWSTSMMFDAKADTCSATCRRSASCAARSDSGAHPVSTASIIQARLDTSPMNAHLEGVADQSSADLVLVAHGLVGEVRAHSECAAQRLVQVEVANSRVGGMKQWKFRSSSPSMTMSEGQVSSTMNQFIHARG